MFRAGTARRRVARSVAVALLGLGATATGCGADTSDDGAARDDDTVAPSPAPAAPEGVAQPAPNDAFDYQIGGPYPPAADVRVVVRDRAAPPEPGLYNVCYLNAFQTQPEEIPWWERNHPDLLLRSASEEPVMDREWGEALLDTTTRDKREKLAGIVGGWIDACAHAGYQAIEPDNLDSFSRSDGRLTMDQNASFAQLLAQRAHAAGLAVGQKNTAEMLERRAAIGFDFAVAEECAAYDECDAYAAAFAGRVLVVEYDRADFDEGCRVWGDRLSIVLRDRDVTPPGNAAHVYRSC